MRHWQLLGKKFDKNLTFDDRISVICEKAVKKNSVYTILANCAKPMLKKAFSTWQFVYCPLVLMCLSRANNNKTNILNERCSRSTCKEKQSSFNEFLEKDGSVLIRIRNTQILATEICKHFNWYSLQLETNFIIIRIFGKTVMSCDGE